MARDLVGKRLFDTKETFSFFEETLAYGITGHHMLSTIRVRSYLTQCFINKFWKASLPQDRQLDISIHNV